MRRSAGVRRGARALDRVLQSASRSILLLAPLLTLTACGAPDGAPASETDDSSTVVDADGRRVKLAPAATRIVSLVPSATLTLAALGAQGALVARTDHDTAAWALPLPSVGGGLNPSLEAIAAAQPDLVVRFGGPQDVRTPAALDQLGIRHVAIRPDRIADVLAIVELLGAVTDRRHEAARLGTAIRAGLDSVRGDAARGVPLRAAYVLGGTPPWVAGPGTFVHELLVLVGAVNVFGDLGSLYASVSVEDFIARDIEVLVTPDPGRLDDRVRGRSRVVGVGGALEIPGPGVVQEARRLLDLLYPPGDAP